MVLLVRDAKNKASSPELYALTNGKSQSSHFHAFHLAIMSLGYELNHSVMTLDFDPSSVATRKY